MRRRAVPLLALLLSLAAFAAVHGQDGPRPGKRRAPTPPPPPPPPAPEEPPPPPRPPKGLTHFLTGEPEDAEVGPRGPGVVLMGGGPDVDEAFHWMRGMIDGGDVVVLRTSGSDGYNLYLHEEIGGCDSVETLLVTTRALANSDYVAWRVATAEAVFVAGGDQSTYVEAWKGTRLVEALHLAFHRGAVIGGTSAGAAILGEFVFAAREGGVRSTPVLADPFHAAVTLERDVLHLSFLDGCLVDSHVGQRNRRGRLLTFLARVVHDGWRSAPLGIGIDERTALVIGPGGKGKVLGRGKVTLLRPHRAPTTCVAGQPLEIEGVSAWTLSPGDGVDLPAGVTAVGSRAVHAAGGVLRE